MSTLPERFAWIFDHRRTNPGALSEAAGLSRSHIGGMLRKIEAGDDPNPTRKTMTRIAKAANVSARWLMLGVGGGGGRLSGNRGRQPAASKARARGKARM